MHGTDRKEVNKDYCYEIQVLIVGGKSADVLKAMDKQELPANFDEALQCFRVAQVGGVTFDVSVDITSDVVYSEARKKKRGKTTKACEFQHEDKDRVDLSSFGSSSRVFEPAEPLFDGGLSTLVVIAGVDKEDCKALNREWIERLRGVDVVLMLIIQIKLVVIVAHGRLYVMRKLFPIQHV